MRKRRTENTAGEVTEAMASIVEKNTFGGGKHGPKFLPRQMPQINNFEGIKLEWDNRADKYPSYISIKMTDGEWAKYQLFVEQPAISPALEAVANIRRGYPPER